MKISLQKSSHNLMVSQCFRSSTLLAHLISIFMYINIIHVYFLSLDAITTIKETQESQDCSRSPSPEIPFLKPEKHSEHHSSSLNQKLQDNVTLSNKSPSYSDKDGLHNKDGPPNRGSPHRSSGESKADGTQREQTLDDCNKTDFCDATLVPSSQTDVSDEDMDRDSGSAGCSADAVTSKSSLRLKSKSEKSDQSLVETEMDENNVTSESSQGKGKRKQKQKKRKRKNKTLTVADQVHKEESLTVSPKKSVVETESQEMDNTDERMTNTENDATEHTSEMSDVSEVASQSLGKKRKKHKKKQNREGLESTFSDQQLEVISEEASTAAAPVTGSDEPSSQYPPQTTGENDCIGSNAVDTLSSPNHLTKESTHGRQNDTSSTTPPEKTEGRDKESFLKPMTPKKSLIPKLSPTSKMNKSCEDSLSPKEQKKTKTNLLSIFSVTGKIPIVLIMVFYTFLSVCVIMIKRYFWSDFICLSFRNGTFI